MGKSESQAVKNLQSRTSKPILKIFKDIAQLRGLNRFITHDALARGVLNLGYTSGHGSTEAWQGVLTNGDDDRVVP